MLKDIKGDFILLFISSLLSPKSPLTNNIVRAGWSCRGEEFENIKIVAIASQHTKKVKKKLCLAYYITRPGMLH